MFHFICYEYGSIHPNNRDKIYLSTHYFSHIIDYSSEMENHSNFAFYIFAEVIEQINSQEFTIIRILYKGDWSARTLSLRCTN